MHTPIANPTLLAQGGVDRLHDLARAWRGHRLQRVAGLLTVVVALSMLDLAMTVRETTRVGMFEGNPLARLVIEMTDSVAGLAVLKAISLAISLGLLARLRRHWQAELGAWVAASVLVWLTFQWGAYLHAMADVQPDMLRGLGWNDGLISAR